MDTRRPGPDRASADVHADLDRAYHAKYDRHGPAIVGTVVGEAAARTTLRLVSSTRPAG